jgi:hypothetical protein
MSVSQMNENVDLRSMLEHPREIMVKLFYGFHTPLPSSTNSNVSRSTQREQEPSNNIWF